MNVRFRSLSSGHAGHAASLLVVFAAVVLGHIWSLGDGLFLDDHYHRDELRRRGWGWHDLVESATIELPGRVAECWWQTETFQWRNLRPLSVMVRKLEWIAAGNRVWVVHAFGVGWHAVCGLLVYALAVVLFKRRAIAAIAGCFFALNPHSAFAVSWIAGRNGLVSTAFILLALISYVRAWDLCLTRQEGRRAADAPAGQLGAPTLKARRIWLIMAMAAWGLALLSKEIAVVVPALWVGLDVACRGPAMLRARRHVYLLIAAVVVTYLVWRLWVFPSQPPPLIYYHRPEGIQGVGWLLAKLVHQVLCVAVFTPMVGSPINPLRDAVDWGLVTMMALPLVPIVAWYGLISRRSARGIWYWPVFIVITLVPVVPVFSRPDFAYLPFVAYGIMGGLVVVGHRGWPRTVALVFVAASTLWSLGLYRLAWRGICRSEQLLIADATECPPSPEARHLFFIDLPITSVYATVALRHRWQRPALEGHVLTFSPHPLAMHEESTLTQLDAHTFVLSLEEPGFFAGITGRMIALGMRPDEQLREGQTIVTPHVAVTVEDADRRGVYRLRFRFHQPLNRPELRFFRSGPHRPAQPVVFRGRQGPFPWQVPDVDPGTPEHRAWASRHARALVAIDLYYRITSATRRLVRSELFLTGQ